MEVFSNDLELCFEKRYGVGGVQLISLLSPQKVGGESPRWLNYTSRHGGVSSPASLKSCVRSFNASLSLSPNMYPHVSKDTM